MVRGASARRASSGDPSLVHFPRPMAFVVGALAAVASACDGAGGGDDGAPPTVEARLEDWEALPEGTSVPVALGFDAPMSDSLVAALLERHGLRPYAVYMRAADLETTHERDRSRASLEVLAEGREQTVQQMRTLLCAQQGRARAILDKAGPEEPLDDLRPVLSTFLRMQETLPRLELGEPLVYGIAAVGTLPDVQGARAEEVFASFEPGWRTRVAGMDTVIVPVPTAPTAGPTTLDPIVTAMPREQLASRGRELADTGMGSCEDASGSVEER